ncbi:MAG TPA: hypothetical protein VNP04_15620 [Alphaproteobacteria bacterium]|nr:hypothetical protein [Alphaproteobacteria bacterium]
MRTDSFRRFARRFAHRFGGHSAVAAIHDQQCRCQPCAAVDHARRSGQGVTPIRLRDAFLAAGYVPELAALFVDSSAYDGRLQVAYLRVPCGICLHSSGQLDGLTCPYCQGTGYREGGLKSA